MKSRSQTTTLVQEILTTPEHLAAEVREDIADAAHHMGNVTSQAVNSVLRTLHFDQLPSWMQNDPYIQRGYRKPTGAIKDCLHSLWYPHNELVNTWSHLLPAMFFIALLVGVDYLELKELEHSGKEIRWADLAMMQFYFVCTALCLLFSVSGGSFSKACVVEDGSHTGHMWCQRGVKREVWLQLILTEVAGNFPWNELPLRRHGTSNAQAGLPWHCPDHQLNMHNVNIFRFV